jgi:hypothetical protein
MEEELLLFMVRHRYLMEEELSALNGEASALNGGGAFCSSW